MSDLPTTDDLHCFLEAARTLNFRSAASAVHLSPAAFGQRIRGLEELCGESLFHRTTRTVVLTEAGLELVPRARRTLEAAKGCLALNDERSAPVEITLGTRHELGLSWLVPALEQVAQAHPSLTPHLYFGSGNDLVARVRSLDIDCAITSSRLIDPMLDSTRLHEERYAFVGSSELLRGRSLRHAEDASDHVLIDTTADLPLFRYWRDAPSGSDRMRFARVWRVGTIEAIRELVRAGQGVAVLPAYFVAEDLKHRRLRRILPRVRPLSDYFRLVYRADDPRVSLFRALAATLARQPLR